MASLLTVSSIAISDELGLQAVCGPHGALATQTAAAMLHFNAAQILAGPFNEPIRLMHRPGHIELYCNWDGSARNNLLDLPLCAWDKSWHQAG